MLERSQGGTGSMILMPSRGQFAACPQVERPEALDHINEVSPVPDEAWIASFNFSSFLSVEGC